MTEPDATSISVCPVHKLPAHAPCDRCGIFLCVRCPSLGEPPLCKPCLDHENKQLKPHPPMSPVVRSIILALVVAFALMMASMVIAILFMR